MMAGKERLVSVRVVIDERFSDFFEYIMRNQALVAQRFMYIVRIPGTFNRVILKIKVCARAA
jgi:hypothetical protein